MRKLNFENLIIDVHVNDLQRAVDFYRDVLGLHLMQKTNTWASFSIGTAEIHLYLYGGLTQGLEFRVADISAETIYLQDKEVEFIIEQNQPNFVSMLSDAIMQFTWGKAVFFKDSEGNILALVQDR